MKLLITEKINYQNEGVEYFLKKQFKEAKQSFRKAFQTDPTNPINLFNMARVCEELGELEQAEDFYCAARIFGYSDAIFNLAVLYKDQGRTVEARDLFYEYTTKVPPTDPHAIWVRVNIKKHNLEVVCENSGKHSSNESICG